MPPKFPVVSGAEAVRALERLGFSVIRQRGSHIISGILKQAGVSADEFIASLHCWKTEAFRR